MGSHGKIESIQRRNYSDQFYEYSQLGRIRTKEKVSMQRNPGWKAVDKAKFYIGINVPNLKKKRKKKEKKRREKEKKIKLKQVYRYTLKVYRYNLLKNGQ